MSDSKAFKDWFDAEAAEALGKQVRAVHKDFKTKRFVQQATQGLADLEFAGRVQSFADALRAHLPDDIPEALEILTRSLPPPLPDCDSVTGGWLLWPVGQFIADHGVEHFEVSMRAMTELTQRFSAEFAVRPFVETHQDRTVAHLLELASTHPSPHVRRWCSEGVRPRLPWGARLRAIDADPSPILPILETLRDDPERYVNRSVANTLGDVLKQHPDTVLSLCERWASDEPTSPRLWTIQHALRTLVKAGEPRALALAGFGPPRKLDATLEASPDAIEVGEAVEWTATLSTTSTKPQALLLDYVLHFAKAGGKTSEKVFKWTKLQLPARGTQTLTKRHTMRETTIRRLYAGVHRVELQINGKRMAETSFRLTGTD